MPTPPDSTEGTDNKCELVSYCCDAPIRPSMLYTNVTCTPSVCTKCKRTCITFTVVRNAKIPPPDSTEGKVKTFSESRDYYYKEKSSNHREYNLDAAEMITIIEFFHIHTTLLSSLQQTIEEQGKRIESLEEKNKTELYCNCKYKLQPHIKTLHCIH